MVDWERAYRLLNEVTPLTVDCGRLCGAICCTEWEKGVGMYLLPGEEVMFGRDEDWLVWQEHSTEEYEFCPGWRGTFYFVRCRGTCPRDKRPFACRTFPVSPYLSPEGTLELRLESAAVPICPLVKAGDINLLDRRLRFLRDTFNISKRLDCGIAMLHVEIAALNSDMQGEWEFLEAPKVAKFHV